MGAVEVGPRDSTQLILVWNTGRYRRICISVFCLSELLEQHKGTTTCVCLFLYERTYTLIVQGLSEPADTTIKVFKRIL